MVVVCACRHLPVLNIGGFQISNIHRERERERDKERRKERERITCLHTQITERSRGGERNNYTHTRRQRRDMRERELQNRQVRECVREREEGTRTHTI